MLSVVMLSVVVPFSLHLNEKGVGGIYSAGEGMQVAGNTNWKGMLSTVDLLIQEAYFIQK